jgi:hypothetical protein
MAEFRTDVFRRRPAPPSAGIRRKRSVGCTFKVLEVFRALEKFCPAANKASPEEHFYCHVVRSAADAHV